MLHVFIVYVYHFILLSVLYCITTCHSPLFITEMPTTCSYAKNVNNSRSRDLLSSLAIKQLSLRSDLHLSCQIQDQNFSYSKTNQLFKENVYTRCNAI